MDETQQFSWENSDDVLVQPTDGVAVYTREDGQITIRQQDYLDRSVESDFIIVVPRERLKDLIERLQIELQREDTWSTKR